jgi:Amt family ammonium transporter
MLGAASGAVAGLVAITPAAGNVGIPGAFVIGLAAGSVCLWGVTGLKRLIKADDSLDVFGMHALGGALGALAHRHLQCAAAWAAPVRSSTGSDGKMGYPGIGTQLLIQAKAVLVVTLWTAQLSLRGVPHRKIRGGHPGDGRRGARGPGHLPAWGARLRPVVGA